MRISDWSSDVCSSDLGHWMFQEHKAVSEALRDYATFSSEHFSPDAFAAMMAELPDEERVPAPVPIAIDPPPHTKLRHPQSSTFWPQDAMALAQPARALAERRLGDVRWEKGRAGTEGAQRRA